MPKTKGPGYYAVKKGRELGVYSTWSVVKSVCQQKADAESTRGQCERNVSGFPGAVHQKFSTREQAERWVGIVPASPCLPSACLFGESDCSPYGRPKHARKKWTPPPPDHGYSFRRQEGQRTPWAPQHRPTPSRARHFDFTALSTSSSVTPSTPPRQAAGTSSARQSTKRPYDAPVREKMKQVVVEDESGWTIAYTDGACKDNGKESAQAGVGVWWGPNDTRYYPSLPCHCSLLR